MFNANYRYLNKWFVVGTITDIQNQTRGDGSSYGAQFIINTGNPSGNAYVRLPNNKNVPDAYAQAGLNYDNGSRVAFGIDRGTWVRLEEREYNGRTYRSFTDFRFPRLALQSESDRATGKVIGELLAKEIVDQHYTITVVMYETNQDGTERLSSDGESQPHTFTLNGYGEVANTIHTTQLGANVECSVRLLNEVVRDEFGDVESSTNELRVEKFKVLQVASAVPSFTPTFATQPSVAQPSVPFAQPTTFTTPPPSNVPPAFATPSPVATQTQPDVPFPNVFGS